MNLEIRNVRKEGGKGVDALGECEIVNSQKSRFTTNRRVQNPSCRRRVNASSIAVRHGRSERESSANGVAIVRLSACGGKDTKGEGDFGVRRLDAALDRLVMRPLGASGQRRTAGFTTEAPRAQRGRANPPGEPRLFE